MRELYCCILVFLYFLARGSFAHEVFNDHHGLFSFPSLVNAVNHDDDSLDIAKLFKRLHYQNCSTSRGHDESCHKCFSLENSTGYKASALLNSTEFLQIAPLLVYYLLPPEQNSGHSRAVCKTPPLPEKLFDALVANYSGEDAKGITEEALDEILEQINETSGKYLHRKECFSAQSIFEEIQEDRSHEGEEENRDHDSHESEHSSLDKDDFQKACASILFHLVEGYCIEEGHAHNETSNLPPKTFFISSLFGGKQRLTEASLKGLTKKLGIGKAASTSHTEEEDHDHGHKRRRSVDLFADHSLKMVADPHSIRRRAVEDNHSHAGPDEEAEHARDQLKNFSSTCFSLDDMLTVFGVDHDVGADKHQFKELCPAFIQQLQSGVCSFTDTTTTQTVTRDMAKIWGYGFVAVTIISLCSLVGVATIPFIRKKLYKKVLALLVALAVGSLAGDGVLHLIPHAFGLHGHEHTGEDFHGPPSENQFLWKALVVLAAVYAFYLFETLMHLCLKHQSHEHNAHSHIDTEHPRPSSYHTRFKDKRTNCSNLEHHEGLPPAEDEEKSGTTSGEIVLSNLKPVPCSPTIDLYVHNNTNQDTNTDETQNTGSKEDATWNGNTHLSFSHENNHNTKKNISSVAWMIIIGDTLHNISDGLAIGAAFSEGGNSGISGGISTSIAVFCHELPHELGDFAVLLNAGMSVKTALLANFLSACSCYVGLVIGIVIGQHTDVRLWIFAIAGGMFIYVALVDMLPDLMHSETLQTEPVVTFALQNVGLITGIVIMLLIALYEEQLMALKL